ncbi:hypothetical protein BDV41DRAFT_572429 [Aspergillus transmontanensis]|uniref:Uncharacterized protein n=1 Tax=Aspergillus transmontanensis TaxID=1034304 RepID=A0A5N6WAT9_9EURO|nr:hypothetical protein BDV41DRAFT_572429 [Aspergillus transmontanensis]
MEAVDDNGFSIHTDIGQLRAVMYEVTTGQKCDWDLFKDSPPDDGPATWPARVSLPSTDRVWPGPIIEKCWTPSGFQNAHCLLRELISFVPLLEAIDRAIQRVLPWTWSIQRNSEPVHCNR